MIMNNSSLASRLNDNECTSPASPDKLPGFENLDWLGWLTLNRDFTFNFLTDCSFHSGKPFSLAASSPS